MMVDSWNCSRGRAACSLGLELDTPERQERAAIGNSLPFPFRAQDQFSTAKKSRNVCLQAGKSLDCGSGKTSPVFRPGLRVGKGNLAWDGGMETWVLFPEPGCSLLWVKLPAEPWKTSRMQRQERSHWSPGSASTGWIYPWSWNYHCRCSAAWSGGC